MKFGANLQRNIYPPWEQEYIKYDRLKYYLKERQLSLTGWTKTDERYFAENLVATELDKVYQFIDLKLKNTESRIKEMRQLEFSNNFDTESQHINLLLNFIEINNLGFQKIVKKHNKWTFSDLNEDIKISSYPQRFKIFKTRADQLFYIIKEIGLQKNKKIDIIRETKKRESSAMDTKTIVTTFWVHPDNLSQVQAIVLFNLPNINSNDSTQPFNSMTLDNAINFTMYSDLIERKRKAELIQIEWQEGTNESVSSIELRVHQETWTKKMEYYIADTFLLDQNRIKDYVDNPCKEQARKKLNVSIPTSRNDSISALIEKKQLEPIIRAQSNRFIYRKSTKSNFQVIIDTNVRFLNEKKLRVIGTGIDQGTHHSENQLVQPFPFAIMELRQEVYNMPGSHPIPDWLSDLIHSGLLYEVPLFSPYLHGISCFYQNNVLLRPWWLDEMKKDVRKGNSSAGLQPNVDDNRECFTSVNPSRNELGTTKSHSVVNITNDQGPDYFQQNHYNKPDHAFDIDISCFSNTHYDNRPFSTFYSLDKGIDLKSHGNISYSKESVTPREVLLETPIVSKIKNLKGCSHDDGETNPKYDNVGMASWLFGRLRKRRPDLIQCSMMNENPSKRGKPKKLEPKIFFANERTFISWLQFSAFLLTVSLGLINFGDKISRFSGGFFIILSVLLSVYALLRFQYRSWQIRMRNDTRFDDRWGPAVLCVVLVIALIINFGLRVSQPAPANPSLFGLQQDDILTDKIGGNINIYDSNTTDQNIESDKPKNKDAEQKERKENNKDQKNKEPKEVHKSINDHSNDDGNDTDDDED